MVSCVAPLFLWMSIVVPRPHKEERFLFAIYPALCACAAMTLEQLWLWTVGRWIQNEWMRQSAWIVLLVPACLMCISRTFALTMYYTAPLSVYSALAQQDVDVRDASNNWSVRAENGIAFRRAFTCHPIISLDTCHPALQVNCQRHLELMVHSTMKTSKKWTATCRL